MYYFKTLPKIITPDENGYPILMTNLLARASMVQELLNNTMQFYEYAIQDGDTPEIVADKYYGDAFKYWIVLFSNQILDPVWEWPMTYATFLEYLDAKYATEAEDAGKTPFEYTQTTVYEYKKVITTTDVYTRLETIKEVSITLEEYNTLVESTVTYDIPSPPVANGTQCVVTTSKTIVTLYDYEEQLNESRRQIKLLNSTYAGEMERQLKALMKVA
jgi:hypothetical protein